MRDVAFSCSIRPARCGMPAVVDSSRIVEVIPDRRHPLSRGYSCSKGRAMPARHHASDRLDRPRIQRVDVSWDLLLDNLADRLELHRRDHGSCRIGLCQGTANGGSPGSSRHLDPGSGTPPSPCSHTPGPANLPDLDGIFGDLPATALADEIEAGDLTALFVFGGNPLASIPDPDRTLAALRRLDVLVVMDVRDNPLDRHHAIPCTWITERASFLYGPFDGSERAYYSPAFVAPALDRRHA